MINTLNAIWYKAADTVEFALSHDLVFVFKIVKGELFQ